MSKHNELRDKINELCPELMKLEFGCEVYEEGLGGGILLNEPIIKNGIIAARVITKDGEVKLLPFMEDKAKIFGKDPTLEDVMRAIERTDSSFNVIYERGGRINLTVKVIEENDNYTFYWELGKPLSQQSFPTVEAILEILK